MDVDKFVAILYDTVKERGRRGAISVQFEDADMLMPEASPEKPWRWTVLGDRVFWFLQIHDAREPTYGQPYQLEAGRNFFPWAQNLEMATRGRVAEFVEVLVTAMDDQELGQREAAGDPLWRERGEYFNPWASHSEEPPLPSPVPDEMASFMRELFDFLTIRKESGQFPWDSGVEHPSSTNVHPRQPRFQDHWRWTLGGWRNHWWLEVVDPYRLDLSQEESFSRLAPLGCDTAFQVLTASMDEGLLGQSEAQRAYDGGAIASKPPWVVRLDA